MGWPVWRTSIYMGRSLSRCSCRADSRLRASGLKASRARWKLAVAGPAIRVHRSRGDRRIDPRRFIGEEVFTQLFMELYIQRATGVLEIRSGQGRRLPGSVGRHRPVGE